MYMQDAIENDAEMSQDIEPHSTETGRPSPRQRKVWKTPHLTENGSFVGLTHDQPLIFS